jgi:hypothetical protein
MLTRRVWLTLECLGRREDSLTEAAIDASCWSSVTGHSFIP